MAEDKYGYLLRIGGQIPMEEPLLFCTLVGFQVLTN